jgi:hypothetical protein
MRQSDRRISTRLAEDFLMRSFAPGESIALLLRRARPGGTSQRIVLLEKALEPRYLGWLRHENSTGANIYVAANPLLNKSRRRTKESVATVRHLYLDIDNDGQARLAALRASNATPAPTAIVSTSPNKYQILWSVEGFDSETQETILKLLAIAFGTDRACTDCNRVLRVPGFLNWKYVPAYLVTVEYPCSSVWSPADFRIDVPSLDLPSPSRRIKTPGTPGKRTTSEEDWAWVLKELASGRDAIELTAELASRRCDKPNPFYYAQRTVDVASARLWLIRGVPMQDVIAMLEQRRRVPARLGSARSREIAQTASQMLTYKFS